MTDYSREKIIDYIEEFYCDRMTTLVEDNRIADADALHLEFEVTEKNFEWIFLSLIEDVH